MPAIDPKYLIAYAANDMPENETDPCGGGIDATIRVQFSPSAPKSTLDITCGGGDAGKVLTVVMRDKSGHKVVLPITLVGGGNSVSTSKIQRVLKATLASPAAGTIEVKADSSDIIGTIAGGERGFTSLFIDSFFDLSEKHYYMKFFWKNTAPASDIQDPVAQRNKFQSMFDEVGLVDFALSSVLNDEEATANRLSPPSAIDGFSDSDKSVPTNGLPRAQCIGVWLRLNLRRRPDFKASTFTFGARLVAQNTS